MKAPGPLVVRQALPQDAEAVARIYVASWNAGFAGLMPHLEGDAVRTERWRATLAEPPPQRWWVALRAGEIVGFAGIGPCRDPQDASLGELDTIAIDPPAWRSGVGRVLMARATETLRADGYREAVLWTLGRYPRGAAFYAALGWTATPITRNDGRQVLYSHPLGER